MSPESLKIIYDYNMDMIEILPIPAEDKLEWLLNLKTLIANYKENMDVLQKHWLKTKRWERYQEDDKKRGGK